MNEIPDAIIRYPDGTEVKCRGLFISPSYAAALAKALGLAAFLAAAAQKETT